MNPAYILRIIFFGRVTTQSQYLLPSQQRALDRLLNVKKVGCQYLREQKEKKDKGEPVPPFMEVFLNFSDESYYDEVVQHLIVFVFAGSDTTGSIIEVCLYKLAEYPEYQDKILKSIEAEPNIHASKVLNNFINETNRLVGPARMSLMRVVTEPFSVDGFEFQKGEGFWFSIGMPMTNAKYFDDPWEFRPDRFNSPL